MCEGCRSEYQPVRSPICTVCGRIFTGREGQDHLCGDCIAAPKHFHKARAAVVSTRGLMRMIHQFKYHRKLQLADPFGFVLLLTYCENWPERDIQVLMPVPLHIKRLRQRGFNQAYLLIRRWNALAEAHGLELGNMAIYKNALVRTDHTRPQTGFGKAQRARNVRNAFAVVKRQEIENKNVLLIDDVYTTGATVNECAGALRRSGAARVDVLTLARAL
jgi:ComF family protein